MVEAEEKNDRILGGMRKEISKLDLEAESNKNLIEKV